MSGCTLCDLALPADPVTHAAVDGEYCCCGCLEVARTLDDADPAETDPEAVERETTVADADGEVAYLSVDGMHCSTCEVFLESTATECDGIEAAAASYATDTMQVVYDEDALTVSELADRLSVAGYDASQRSVTDRQEAASPTAAFLVGGGFFGMMTMVWYVLFIYPQHFGFAPVVEFGAFGRLYLLGQLWLFASIVLFYTGFPLLRGAYVSLRAGQPNMDLLVSLAAVSAYLYSSAITVLGGIDVYFDVTVAIVLAVTAGNYYERGVKREAVDLLSDLTGASVETARTRDGEQRPVDAVTPGTELLVRPGERIPLDGTVVEGVAAVDEALVTGESLPVTRRPGDEVVGGGIVTDAPLVVEVGPDATSTLDRIVGLLWSVQTARPGVQRLADRLATVFVPVVVTVAVFAAGATLILGGTPTSALLVGLTVLVVSCPCALGLATPLAVAAGVQRAAEDGIVVASGTLFETLPETDVVAIDKTGTLTSGRMTVRETLVDDEAAIERAAALERYATHPVADAIVADAAATAEDEGVAPAEDEGTPTPRRESVASDGGSVARPETESPALDAESVTVEPTGVVGPIDGQRTVVGHPGLLAEAGLTIPDRYAERAAEATASGAVPVLIGWNGRCRGLFVVADEPRATWQDTVAALSDGDRDVVVLTGDDEAAAAAFGDHPDVDEVFAGLPPDGKVAAIRRLRDRGRVAMIGDGANDAPALAAADVGVAIAGGTSLPADAADAVVADGRLAPVPTLFALATGTRRRVRQNLVWALCYNAVAVPLAAAGLLNPLFAALAMAASSTLVVLNSGRRLVPRK
ncbi:heavy metal translocating P-type ATPase [Halobellus salinus]|uniref:heavy metal translocating P-type ATPase n=1 Tax=Halobellus salinus TaxID=931585 RepID=UPI0016646173|nr:cation-translocating P-type ATPase [Halobellus salinus]